MLAVNLTGVWLCMKYDIPQMLQQGGGTIVTTTSVVGLVGLAGRAATVASKHGVVGIFDIPCRVWYGYNMQAAPTMFEAV